MMRFRRFFFWIHLVAGVTAGLVIFVLSVTGAALALKPQILRAVDTARFSISAAGRQPLSASALADAVRSASPGADVRSVTIQRDATEAATAQIGSRLVYLDPYSGSVLGEPSQQTQQIFRSIENWHRWFAMQGDSRQTGRAITGIANVVFLFLALSGLWLWVPRRWTLRHLRPVTFFRRTSTPKARDFNWHNVAGLWSLPMIVVMTLTGAFLSYPSLNGQLQQALGGSVTMARGGPGRGPGGDAGRTPEGSRALEGAREGGPNRQTAASAGRPEMAGGANAAPVAVVDGTVIDGAVTELQSREPGWQTISVEMPRAAATSVTLSASTGGSTPSGRSQLVVDSKTAAVTRWQPATTTAPVAQRVRTWIRFGHTGELWGVTGQVLAGLSCLGGALLVWTGVSLAVRRLAAFMRRPAAIARRHDARSAVPMPVYVADVVRREA